MTVNMQSLVSSGTAAGLAFFATYGATGSLMAGVVAAGSAFFGGLSGAAAHSAYTNHSIQNGGGATPPPSKT